MPAEAFIQCRVPQATKAALRAAAERQLLTESTLLKRVLELVLNTTETAEAGSVIDADRPRRQARLYVRLTVGDRQLLQARSAARCALTCARTSAPISQAGVPVMPRRSFSPDFSQPD